MVEALVLFDYKAQAEDELNLQKGDIIKQIVQQDGGWWAGTLNGSRGVFPDNFVQVIKSQEMSSPASSNDSVIRRSERVRRCRVLFSYAPNHEDELRLDVGEDVAFLCEVEEGWWKGSAHGKVGVFPSNFVTMVEEPVTTAESVHPAPEFTALNHAPSVVTPSPVVEEAPKLPPKPVKELVRVLYPYASQNEDELDLREGDVITLLSRDIEDKGWWRGELGGKNGVFPDNFVEVIVVGSANHKPDRPDKPVQTATKRSSIESAKEIPSPSSSGASGPSKPLVNKKRWPPVSNPPAGGHESLSDEQKLKNLKPSPSSDFDLDSVEVASDRLQHITANRVRMPKRRPPSAAFLKDENVWPTNQDALAAAHHHHPAEKELLPVTPEEPQPPNLFPEDHQDNKEPPPKAKSPPVKAPWMEELKKSQEKRQPISPKSEVPSTVSHNKTTPPPAASSTGDDKPSVPVKPAPKPVLPNNDKPKVPSFGSGSRPNSVLSTSSNNSSHSSASSPASSQLPVASNVPNKIHKAPAPPVPPSSGQEPNHVASSPSPANSNTSSSDLQQEVLSLRSQVRNLEDMVVALKNELSAVRRTVEEERKMRLLRETSTPTIHL